MKTVNNGFTLVELLIALAISGIIMTGVYSAFKTQQDSYLAQDQVAEMQQNIRAGLYIMTNELRMAGFDIDKNGAETDSAGIIVATPTSISFTMVADTDGKDNNSDGTTDEAGELKTVTYDHYDANSTTDLDHWDLGRQVGLAASTKRAVAENIERLEFYYTLEDGTQTTFSAAAPTTTQLESIRSVQVSVLAITGRPDRNYTNSQTYASASGVDWTPVPPDNFRRRFQSMTVKFRNIGL